MIQMKCHIKPMSWPLSPGWAGPDDIPMSRGVTPGPSPSRSRHPPAWCLRLVFPPLVLAVACADAAGPEPGLDLDAVFLPPTAAEIAAVEADWASRSPVAAGVVEELATAAELAGRPATVRVFSHLVDGVRHHGAAIVPDGAQPAGLPAVVFAHPGDGGVDVGDVLLAAAVIGQPASGFVFVVPAFRSETLRVGGESFPSGGEPSPWDRDVDDVMALLDVVFREVPEADPERVGALGISRGAGVALLLGIRDPRVDLVVEFSGPTDFFGLFVREVVEDALDGRLRPLPGLRHLDERFIRPLAAGTLAVEDFRLELVRRSAVLFAHRLPPVQVHHGRMDAVVAVSQAESLVQAVGAAGGGPPVDEFFLYPDGRHDPLTLAGSVPRAAAFLERLLAGEARGHGRGRVPRSDFVSGSGGSGCSVTYQDRRYSQMAR